MKKRINRTIVFMILTITISVSLLSVGCFRRNPPNREDYTVEEHVQMISEKIEKYFMKDSDRYTSFAVYPLYSKNEEVYVFLVEFEPYDFLFVCNNLTGDEYGYYLGNAMYGMDLRYMGDDGHKCRWRRYRIGHESNPPEPFNSYGFRRDRCDLNHYGTDLNDYYLNYYELSEDGNYVYYEKSPYAIAGKLDKKKYLFTYGIPVVEENGKLINVISMLEYEDLPYKHEERLEVSFYFKSVRPL